MARAQRVDPRCRAGAQLGRAADRRDVGQAFFLRAARAGTVGPGADEAEQREDLMLRRQQLHVDRGGFGAVLVVERHELDRAPADAAARVRVGEHRIGSVANNTSELGLRAGDRRRLAEPDRLLRLGTGPRRQRQQQGRRGGQRRPEQSAAGRHDYQRSAAVCTGASHSDFISASSTVTVSDAPDISKAVV